MHRRKFRLTPSVLAIPLFLCSFAGIVTAGAEERMHGLEIFRSGNIVITSSAVSDGIAKKGDRASLHDRWCRPRLVVDIYSPNREPFDGNREGLKRALEEFRTFLSADCPRASQLPGARRQRLSQRLQSHDQRSQCGHCPRSCRAAPGGQSKTRTEPQASCCPSARPARRRDSAGAKFQACSCPARGDADAGAAALHVPLPGRDDVGRL